MTVNGVVINVAVNVGGGIDTFAALLQEFETEIDTNVPLVDASLTLNTLTIQSNTGDAVSMTVSNVAPGVGAGDPTH